jgi:phosphoadenosine phosphosulfate reductase
MPLLEDDLSRPLSSPLWGGDKGGGNHDGSGIPPFLSLPRDGRGDGAIGDGEADPAGPIWRDGAFRRDTWAKVDATAALPDGAVVLPKKRWLAERNQLAGRNTPLGLLISAGEGADDIAADLPRFALIALDFPKFSDGRAFSTARLLREKYGYAGELRAVGDVLADQIPLMRRVGFDTFEVENAPTRRALAEGRLAEVKLHYQPVGAAEPPAGTRPWLRRTPDRS